MFIIGMHGPKRSGKDFGATILIQALQDKGFNVHRDSFARNLRELAVAVTNRPPQAFDQDKDRRGTFGWGTDTLLMGLRLLGHGPQGDNLTATQIGEWQHRWLSAIVQEQETQAGLSPITARLTPDGDMELVCTGRDILIILGQAARRISVSFWTDALAEDLKATQQPDTIVVLTDVRPENEASFCDFVVTIENPRTEFNNSATEKPLPDHLVHARVTNPGNETYGYAIKSVAEHVAQLVKGRSLMTPQMYSRTFLRGF
ncbi:hypothetical protein HOS47_gp23 [Pseudomonas phage uligo]|uniref:Deoxynucleoside monophosphate kinase n=1 Tax=Pseudomonas phage uligo TaxID=2048979 RepID=A0A2H4P7L9_9CAUD|nr:hypothetical protein HOS47_gp23 [Pseudomonas phage uligo]ATW58182.1 hypothetical protein [Pseudomonas phage uligo]